MLGGVVVAGAGALGKLCSASAASARFERGILSHAVLVGHQAIAPEHELPPCALPASHLITHFPPPTFYTTHPPGRPLLLRPPPPPPPPLQGHLAARGRPGLATGALPLQVHRDSEEAGDGALHAALPRPPGVAAQGVPQPRPCACAPFLSPGKRISCVRGGFWVMCGFGAGVCGRESSAFMHVRAFLLRLSRACCVWGGGVVAGLRSLETENIFIVLLRAAACCRSLRVS